VRHEPPPARLESTIVELTIYHVVLIIAFVALVAWVFARKRKARFERDAKIPFQDKDG
jgi:cbb3-type cytochrome oxidase subunit 3